MDQHHYSQFKPLQMLSDERIDRLLATASSERLEPSSSIRSNSERNCFVYLVEGEIQVHSPEREDEIFGAQSSRAEQPLFRTEKPTFCDQGWEQTGIAKTPVKILRVDRGLYDDLFQEQTRGITVKDVEVVDIEANVIHKVFDDYQAGLIPVPSMPETAFQVRRLGNDPDVSMVDVAEIIERDPGIAGKIVAAANSVLVRGLVPVTTVRDATIRMGLRATCSLASSLAMRGLFRSNNVMLNKMAHDIWAESVLVASMSRVLAENYHGPIRDVDVDKAFLVGLIHDLGRMSLLSYFDQLSIEISQVAIEGALKKMGTMVSVLVLQHWDMDEDFVEASEVAGEWHLNETDRSIYVDLVTIARHQAAWLSGKTDNMPPVQALSAFGILNSLEVDDDGVLQLLKDNSMIEGLQKLHT